MNDAHPLRCETCGAELIPDSRFCEQCGSRAGADADPASDTKDDRIELDLGAVAAVSERGRTHPRNDDAFYLERIGESVVAVVCDGVSTSISADLAAKRTATGVGGVLAEALSTGAQTPRVAIADAIAFAQSAVRRLKSTTRADLADPACTLVAAIWHEDELVLSWLGDSRAYWLGDTEARQLTVDNSWASEQVAAGILSATEAAADPRARSITRWVGADAPPEPPQLVTLHPADVGLLVLCSDGLWMYMPEARTIARLVSGLPTTASPLAVARSLADRARARGGADDITVAVVDVRPQGG